MKKYSLKTKIIVMTLALTIVPVLIMGIYSIFFVTNNMKEQLHSSSFAKMETTAEFYMQKRENILYCLDLLEQSPYIQSILNNDEVTNDDNIVEDINANQNINGLIISKGSNTVYSQNTDSQTIDLVKLRLLFSGGSAQRRILWNTNTQAIEQTGVTSGNIVAKSFIIDENNEQYDVYLLIDQNFFSDIISNNGDQFFMSILDNNGSLIVTSEHGYDNFMSKVSIGTLFTIFSLENGVYDEKIDNQSVTMLKYRSSEANLTILEIYDSNIFYKEITVIITTMIISIAIVFIVIVFIDILLLKNLTKFLNLLSEIMNNFNEQSLKASLIPGNSKEIDNIIHSFNQMIKNVNSMMLRAKEEENMKNKLIIDTLRYQINPHFLFNTLSVIRVTAIKEKNEKTAESLRLLSRFYKSYLGNIEHEIALKDEIKTLENYVSILNLRYDNLVSVEYDISAQSGDCIMPSLILQPLVENSVNHGFSHSDKDKLKLTIKSNIKDDKLIIEVIDNGAGIEQWKIDRILIHDDVMKKSENIGIANIHSRITTVCGAEYGIRISSDTGENSYTKITILLPLNKKENNNV